MTNEYFFVEELLKGASEAQLVHGELIVDLLEVRLVTVD